MNCKSLGCSVSLEEGAEERIIFCELSKANVLCRRFNKATSVPEVALILNIEQLKKALYRTRVAVNKSGFMGRRSPMMSELHKNPYLVVSAGDTIAADSFIANKFVFLIVLSFQPLLRYTYSRSKAAKN